jgi:hypothetical protein
MPRLYLPLVPIALLAAIAAASACSKGRGEEGDTLRVVPPPAALYAAPAPAPLLASAGEGARAAPAPTAEPEPSAEEVTAFEAPVRK